MKSKIITDAEVEHLKVSSLPTRPTAKEAFGGKGYSADEMKAAFDKLPEFILEKLNLLISELTNPGEDSYVGNFKIGIVDSYTLQNLLDGIVNGEFANLLIINGRSLYSWLDSIALDIREIKNRLGIL